MNLNNNADNYDPTSKVSTTSIVNTNHRNDDNTTRQYLVVESKSVIAHDIQSIWHEPSQQQICIQLEAYGQCPHAEFLGRLSGPSIVMLDWKEYPNSAGGNGVQHCGSYSNGTSWLLLESEQSLSHADGTAEYFVEILVLYCQNFGVGSILRSQHTMMEWLNFNFQKSCVENPQANRVTQLGTSIPIPIKSSKKHSNDEDSMSRGQWIHVVPSMKNNARPLTTRYQPQGCRSDYDNKTTTAHCQMATDTQRFADYKFQWNHHGQEEQMKKRIQKLQWDISATRKQVCEGGGNGGILRISDQKRNCVLQLGEMLQNLTLIMPHRNSNIQMNNSLLVQRPSPIQPSRFQKVCVVGYSHSYHILYAMHQLHLGHHFVWAQAKYPSDIDFHFVQRHMREHHCDTFLVGVGQWPASQWGNPRKWPENKPVPFGVYQHEIFRLVDMFHNLFPKVRVYMRSIHYNPIMEESGKCVPGDWRTPTVMNAYSEIIREQVDKLKKKIRNGKDNQNDDDPQKMMIQFLDTRFITYPMWDSSYDWYHLSDQVAQVEALYIASTVLGGNRASLHQLVGERSEE